MKEAEILERCRRIKGLTKRGMLAARAGKQDVAENCFNRVREIIETLPVEIIETIAEVPE